MKTEQARNFVKDTFTRPFDRARFLSFAKETLNHLDASAERQKRWTNQYVKRAFAEQINHYERLGTYTDPRGEKMDVLAIHLKRETTLERGRTLLRNFAADYLATGHGQGKEAVLAAYVAPNGEDWRFSFVKLEYSLEQTELGLVTERRELTPARRLSFLVGEHERSHTAQKQFLSLLENDQSDPPLETIEEAFKIERVTKEFFQRYKDLYERLHDELASIVKRDAKVKSTFEACSSDVDEFTANFAKKLLGQIVFLYFLQKKGWFGVGRDDEWGTGNKNFLRYLFENKHELGGKQARSVNFFNDILEPLFYEALAIERPGNFYSRFDCKIPFLNGGLFEPLAYYNWINIDILLPDALFSNGDKTDEGDIGTGILDVFDRYNFTVNEAEPLEKEVAVDPEMLGKVFENLLPENERKGKGTYYTPRVIVHYMCQQSLINYLASHLKSAGVERADIETFIRIGERFADFEAHPTGNHQDKLLPAPIRENAAKIDRLLEEIAVCDPAIGSGAFPVGMMQEIVRARLTVGSLKNEQGKPLVTPRSVYELKRHAIQSSLYGVDEDPGAIEIAKLRLWLSLVVDEDDIGDIKPLPNLEYKIMQGNSLLDEFEGEKLLGEDFDAAFETRENLKTQMSKRRDELAAEYQTIAGAKGATDTGARKLKAELERIRKGLEALRDKPQAAADDELFDDYRTEIRRRLKELFDLHRAYFETYSFSEKERLRKRLNIAEWELTEAKLRKEGKKDALRHLEVLRQQQRKPFFLWKLHFGELFQARGGFDVVIANPPYDEVSEPVMKSIFKSKFADVLSGHYDLYIFFFRQAFNLARPGGIVFYITPHTFLQYTQFQRLRDWLYNKAHLIEITSRIEGIFESAIVDNSLTLLVNELSNETSKTNFTHKVVSDDDLQEKSVRSLSKNEFSSKAFDLSAIDNEKQFSQFLQGTEALGQVLDSTQGITVYAKVQGEKINHFRSAKDDGFCKPVTKGREINKYSLSWSETYIRYGSWLWCPRNPVYFESPKILLRQTADTLIGTYVEEPLYCIDSVHSLINKSEKNYDLRYVLGILNSTLGAYLYKLLICETGKVFAQVKLTFLRQIPIKKASSIEQTQITLLVNYVLFLKSRMSAFNSRDTLMLRYFEGLIDALVYELYLHDELHAANKTFFAPLAAERLPALDDITGDKPAALRRIFERLFDKDHIVRQNTFFLDTLESVRIIEGKA